MSIEVDVAVKLDIDPLAVLAERIRHRDARVCILGLGHVGLPLLVTVATAGFPTLGLEENEERACALLERRSYLHGVADSELANLEVVDVSTDPAILDQAEIFVICVPTPLTQQTPDLSMVVKAAGDIAGHLRPGCLVILESTTYPGTTEEVVRPILESSGLQASIDFGLAYSPERIDPGQGAYRIDNVPKVVAGLSDRCRDLATTFYLSFVRDVVETSRLRDAEMAKLIENIFRYVNVALVNELAIIARELGVDIWEALDAASTKPFGYMRFAPGPGVGGHCIPVDPSYLSWQAGQRLGYRIGFIEHASEVNERMPEYVAIRVAEVLNGAGKSLQGARILSVGVAYKEGVDDLRGSPSIAVMQRLARRGAVVSYHDPFVPRLTWEGNELRSQPLLEETIRAQDCVAILTAHPGVDYERLVRAASLVFDARGVTRGIDAPNVVRL
jgi:UDP-N-acetyl-D-glucosamine dehydrogenase